MNLGEIFTYVQLKTGKDVFGGYMTPDNFQDFGNYVQLELLNSCVRVFEDTGELSDDLWPFVKVMGDNVNLPLEVDSYGYADKPSDYWYRARAGYNQIFNAAVCGDPSTREYRSIEFVSQAEFDYRMSTELMAPDTEEPIAVIQNNKLLFRPQGITRVVFGYLRRPLDIYFDYDIIDGEVVYLPPGETHVNASVQAQGSASLSVEYEWPESAHNDLCERIIKFFAIMFRGEFNIQLLDINKPPQ